MIQSLKSILLNNRKGIFITATGTEVGKTYVSSLLINTLKKENIPVKNSNNGLIPFNPPITLSSISEPLFTALKGNKDTEIFFCA